MDDLSDNNWKQGGQHWVDYMEKWSGGSDDSIFIALCHCNQTNNKLGIKHKQEIESYLHNKKMNQHINIHDSNSRQPWRNLSDKIFECSITENEDTITAITLSHL